MARWLTERGDARVSSAKAVMIDPAVNRYAFAAVASLVVCHCGGSESTAEPPSDAGAPTSCWNDAMLDEGATTALASTPYTRYVRPFIGTGGVGYGVGSAFPGPQLPFGMVRPGPDTMGPDNAPAFSHCSGYAYGDSYIYGFSQTRMHGTGIVDYGTIGLMPTLGMTADKTTEKGRRASFSKATEHAAPGSYEVTLDGGTQVEITAAERVGFYRFKFPASADADILIDIGHALPDVSIVDGAVNVDPTQSTITGFAHFSGGYSSRYGGMPVFFAARFSRPLAAYGVWKAGTLAPSEVSRTGGDVGAWASFDTTADGSVGVAIAISFVDVAHAKSNLDAEAATYDFDAIRDAATMTWEQMLGRVRIEATHERDLTIGYTALYHTLLMPTLATDADGSYRGLDGAVHVASGFRYFTDFSLWDTYRTLHPFLSLVYPEWQRDMVQSLLAMAVQSGAPPKWPLGTGETGGMVGDSADVVCADSWARGVRDVDLGSAYDVLYAAATAPLPKGGRDQISEYTMAGFVPIEAGSASGSKTLEYALDDFALATLADAVNKSADATLFRARAGSWKNLWDAESGFLLGRHADGTFPRADDPTSIMDYWAEGTTWQYTWFVPQDVAGLAEAMGGRDAFLAHLDAFFARSSCQPDDHLLPKGLYWQSNEPVLFVPWMFAELDDAVRTATWARWALATNYGDQPDGLPGNDDGGTMSAWWLFAASGIFPRIGTSEYVVGAPALRKVTFALPGGDFSITAVGPMNGSPVRATLNGQPLARARFDQSAISAGGTLEIQLAR